MAAVALGKPYRDVVPAWWIKYVLQGILLLLGILTVAYYRGDKWAISTQKALGFGLLVCVFLASLRGSMNNVGAPAYVGLFVSGTSLLSIALDRLLGRAGFM